MNKYTGSNTPTQIWQPIHFLVLLHPQVHIVLLGFTKHSEQNQLRKWLRNLFSEMELHCWIDYHYQIQNHFWIPIIINLTFSHPSPSSRIFLKTTPNQRRTLFPPKDFYIHVASLLFASSYLMVPSLSLLNKWVFFVRYKVLFF